MAALSLFEDLSSFPEVRPFSMMGCMTGFIKAHPFWSLLIAVIALNLLLFVVFGGIGGSGSGGMQLGH